MDNNLIRAAEIVGSRGRRRRRSVESLRQRAARAGNTAFTAVRFAVGAQGTHHQPPARTAAQSPLAYPLWCGCCAAMARHGRHIAPAPMSPLRPLFTVDLAAYAQ